MEDIRNINDLRKTVRRNDWTYKERLSRLSIALLSWALWLNIAWAALHFSSFSKFWSFLGF
jgi:hypothetical protein